jgi:two-component system, NtrC family, nitrogen regulation response regulator GlnG
MITVVVADNEANLKEMLNAIVRKEGNARVAIIKEENVVKIMSQESVLQAATLKDKIIELEETLYREKEGTLYKAMMDVLEKPLFEFVLERTEGNQLRAARILGINRNTLRTKIKKLGIHTRAYKQ